MASLMDKYTDTTAEAVESNGESPAALKRRRWYEERVWKIIKSWKKTLRKRNKLLEQEIELRKAELEAQQRKAEEAAKHKNGGDGKGFFGGFTKIICKVLPQIVTAAVTAVLGFFFNRKSSKKALQAA